MKFPVVYVVWKDHAEANTEAWAAVSNLSEHKLVDAVTIGFLVHEDEEAIQIAATYVDKYDICGRPDVIAKALIIHRVELQVAEYKPIKKRTKKNG
jgi:hypothetical protein